jgi:Ca2+-binding EF-hand superfamily protein
MSSPSFDRLSGEQQKSIDNCFKRIDQDRSGHLTEEELGTMLKLLGEESTPQKVKQLMKDLDTNNDGHVSLIEFRECMAKWMTGNR